MERYRLGYDYFTWFTLLDYFKAAFYFSMIVYVKGLNIMEDRRDTSKKIACILSLRLKMLQNLLVIFLALRLGQILKLHA